jgi:hypothetical protein
MWRPINTYIKHPRKWGSHKKKYGIIHPLSGSSVKGRREGDSALINNRVGAVYHNEVVYGMAGCMTSEKMTGAHEAITRDHRELWIF